MSGYHRRMRRALALTALLLVAGCDGESGPCTDTAVTILDPIEGQNITAADDVDPAEPLTQYVFVVEARCLQEDEQVSVFLREPRDTLYAGLNPVPMSADAYQSNPVVLLPGRNVFVAVTSISNTESEPVAVTVE